MAKQGIVATIWDRNQQSSKKEKNRILDEFTEVVPTIRRELKLNKVGIPPVLSR